jgi:hypothetical protein
LVGIITPQTLKIEGYIKKKKVIVLIDSGSTHNFIHYKLAKDLNCFVYPAPEFQVMIADGGTINCSVLSLKFRPHMATRTLHRQNRNEAIHGTESHSQHCKRVKNYTK